MTRKRGLLAAATFALAAAPISCSAADKMDTTTDLGTGGLVDAARGTAGATGGNPGTGGAGTGGTTPVDPNARAAIHACMDQLPWGARDMSAAEREPIVAAIINACVEFAPPGAE